MITLNLRYQKRQNGASHLLTALFLGTRSLISRARFCVVIVFLRGEKKRKYTPTVKDQMPLFKVILKGSTRTWIKTLKFL